MKLSVLLQGAVVGVLVAALKDYAEPAKSATAETNALTQHLLNIQDAVGDEVLLAAAGKLAQMAQGDKTGLEQWLLSEKTPANSDV